MDSKVPTMVDHGLLTFLHRIRVPQVDCTSLHRHIFDSGLSNMTSRSIQKLYRWYTRYTRYGIQSIRNTHLAFLIVST